MTRIRGIGGGPGGKGRRRAWARLLLLVVVVVACNGDAWAADVLTSRNSLSRTGVNDAEPTLTPATVEAQTFGKLWALYADGQIVAQPLYVSALQVSTSGNPAAPRVQGTFNAVLVATMHNTVYLYDADHERPGPEGRNVPLWATWLGPPRPGGKDVDMWSTNDPEWGILSTPVIDEAKSIVYVVAWHDDGGPGAIYHYRLHALRLKDGTHVAPPALLQAPTLNNQHHKQRAGLLLTRGVLYIGFGGDGNHGLLLAHDAATLAQKAAWNVTPTGTDGGIWQSGQAPAADADGNVYLMTGNGSFNASANPPNAAAVNFGDSIVRLRLENDAIAVKDYFTPCNERFLNSTHDLDLGSTAPVLIPDARLVFGGGKQGRIYLVSMDSLGKHVPSPQPGAENCANPNVLQELPATLGHLHSSPVFWQQPGNTALVYVWGENDRLRAYRFANRRFDADAKVGPHRPPPPDGMPGGMLSLSSSGMRDGILWAVVPLDGDANRQRGVHGVLLAIDAQDVSKVLWTSEQGAPLNRLGLFAKFVPPTIAGGKVFVATYGNDEVRREYGGGARPQDFPTRYELAVYGMLPDPSAPIVNQSRDDVQLVRADAGGALTIDLGRCRPADAGTVDCTDELQRLSGAPSLQSLRVPMGPTSARCELLRVTTAVKASAAATALDIGFYAADTTPGELSADLWRSVRTADLKEVGTRTLKNGEPALLHEFAGVIRCELAPGVITGKQLKPFVDFLGGPPRTVFRNWEARADNYLLPPGATHLDRSADVFR